MCGIAGGIHTSLSKPGMEQMLQAIAHRGPDDRGIFEGIDVWLGAVRLSIQDISDRGHQPMFSEDGRYVIVYNGELYNHQEIRKDLAKKGIQFHSSSDTETLLQAYIFYGRDCLNILNGIFAFAIHDKLAKTLFIARDHLGVKPFYYYRDVQKILFSSELKAMLRLDDFDYSLRPEVFHQYLLLLYNPGSTTPFKNIQKLLPGHYLNIHLDDLGNAVPQRYYQIPFNGKYDTVKSKKEWISLVDEVLNKAVKKQLISDAPLGCFISGGLDSSLVAAMAKNAGKKQLQCFTIDTFGQMKGEGFEDDLPFAKLASKQLNLPLEIVPGQINIAEEFDQMIWHLDEPQADPAALHVQHISQRAHELGIKVLLSGAGADDVFTGYRRHQAIKLQKVTKFIPAFVRNTLSFSASKTGNKTLSRRVDKLLGSIDNAALLQRINSFFWMPPGQVTELFQPGIFESNEPDVYQYFETLLAEISKEEDALNQMLFWEMKTFLPDHNLNYTDKMSMAASIETRVPYLDIDLIELMTNVPPALKMRGIETKYLLKEIARKYLPKEIVYRKKTGFAAPVRQWMRHELKTIVEERLLSDSFKQWNIFNPEAIRQLITDNDSGRRDGAYTLFSLLAIESWLRQFAT